MNGGWTLGLESARIDWQWSKLSIDTSSSALNQRFVLVQVVHSLIHQYCIGRVILHSIRKASGSGFPLQRLKVCGNASVLAGSTDIEGLLTVKM